MTSGNINNHATENTTNVHRQALRSAKALKDNHLRHEMLTCVLCILFSPCEGDNSKIPQANEILAQTRKRKLILDVYHKVRQSS